MSTTRTSFPPVATTHDGDWPIAARLAVAGVGSFLAATVVTAALTPGYSQSRETISALAATDSRYAAIMIAGFLACAAGLAATAVALWQRFSRHRSGRVAAVMVGLGGAAMVVAGLARQDCSERLPRCVDHGESLLASTHFWVHQYVSLALFAVLTVALFVLARAVRRSSGSADLAAATRVVGLFCVLSIAEMIVDPPALDPYAGLLQRAFVLLAFGWPVLLAALPARREG